MRRNLAALATIFAFSPLLSLSDEPRFDLFCSADGDPGGGGGAVPPPPGAPPAQPQSAPASAPEPPKVDVGKIAKEAKAAARAEFLRDSGFNTEEEFEADKAARKKEADAKLSESERLTKAFEASQRAHAKSAEKLTAAEKERDDARAELSLVKGGVNIDQVDVASYLLSKAKVEAGDAFAQDKWLEKLRSEKPFLFAPGAQTAQPAATTSAAAPSGGNAFGPSNAAATGSRVFDAMKATPEELRAYRANPAAFQS